MKVHFCGSSDLAELEPIPFVIRSGSVQEVRRAYRLGERAAPTPCSAARPANEDFGPQLRPWVRRIRKATGISATAAVVLVAPFPFT